VTNFAVAVNDNDKTIFLNVVTFRKLAENCNKYLNKGLKVLVSGRLVLNEYEKDNKHYKTPEIIAQQVEFLSMKASEEDDLPFPEMTKKEPLKEQPKPQDDDLPF